MIPKNIERKHVLQAFEEIDRSGVRYHRESVFYNVTHEGKPYPPKYVISLANKYANGRELEPSEFHGGTPTNDFLEALGFTVERSKEGSHTAGGAAERYWVEMTDVEGHPDREEGQYKLGTVLWSPQLTKKGQRYYAYDNMRAVEPGDVVLHLPDRKGFSGVSIVASVADDSFICLPGTKWEGQKGYLVKLRDYVELETPFNRTAFLTGPAYEDLKALRKKYGSLFYRKQSGNLTQGAYLTEAPYELVELLNDVYKEQTGTSLPHIEVPAPSPPLAPYTIEKFVDDTGFPREKIENWKRKLLRKKHIIFQGPPGTGKTFVAERLAWLLTSERPGFYEIVQFHPAYSYEDFVQGIRPTIKHGAPFFEERNGRFLDFCDRAETMDDDAHCVLIIDEINRANLPRVFGELMYLLEYRDSEIKLAYSGSLQIPKNVLIIGTMNTADRSIRLFDHALRRRFSFVCLRPQYEVLRHFLEDKVSADLADSLIAVLTDINRKINDPRYEIGISFFLIDNLLDNLQDIWQGEIEPYLEEYFYDSSENMRRFKWEQIEDSIL